MVMPVLSTKTRSLGSICRIRSKHPARSSWMSVRSCSLARSVFFYATTQTAAGRGTASAGLLAAARCAPPTALCIRPAYDRSAPSPAPARSPRPPHRSPACDRRHAAWHSVGLRRAPAGATGTPSGDRRQSAGRRWPAGTPSFPSQQHPLAQVGRIGLGHPRLSSSEMPPFYPRARCFLNSIENRSSHQPVNRALGIDMPNPSAALRDYATEVASWLRGNGPPTHLPQHPRHTRCRSI